MRKILFILGKDVHNKAAYSIYQECIKRGFLALVYASTLNDGHVNLFLNNNVNVFDMKKLSADIIHNCDYIYAAIPICYDVLFRKIKKYIFIAPSTYLDESYFVNDFAFTVRNIITPLIEGEKWPIEVLNNEKMVPAMATGGPQYDEIINMPQVHSKVILFIDAGHFPFGTKKLLADYVIKIAESCSDYEVRIKPRYLSADVDTTHVNRENLFDYLETRTNIPSNLKLIKEHTDLKEELKQCELVICPEGTTSYVEAVLANKRVLLFEGFPNLENELMDTERIRILNKITSNLACRIPYQKIFDYLPEGIQMQAKDLEKLVYKVGNVAADIVDAMEYIYEKYVSKNKFPQKCYYTSKDYICNMEVDPSASWDTIIQHRYRTLLYDIVSVPISRLRKKINYSAVFDYLHQTKRLELNDENIENFVNQLQNKLFDVYIENSEEMMKSFYGQSLLCSALFKRGMLDQICEEKIKQHEYYLYCKAKNEIESGNYTYAIELLNRYFEKITHNQYAVSLADDAGVKASAHYFKGVALYMLGKLEEAKEDFEICQRFWKGTHKKAKEYLKKIYYSEERGK